MKTEKKSRGSLGGQDSPGSIGKQPEFTLNENTQAAIKSTFGTKTSLFQTRVVKEMLDEIEDKPRSMQLFDDLWLEHELAVCFAERGTGKSILAVQIANSIAGGEAIGPFASPPEGQRVLYFDFELSRSQFEARYCFDPDPGQNIFFCPHRFSPNFLWSEIDPCAAAPKDFKRHEDFVLAAIEAEVRESGARVVVIDNIDRFNGEIMRTRDIAYVMSRLKRLKASLGLSILVLAHLPRRNPKQPLTASNLIATRTLCAFADNVFAIGQCRWDERRRYLKHLKARTTDLVYDAEYVPTFLVFKQDGQFLSFTYEGFHREETLLDPYLSKTRLSRSDKIKEMAAGGDSQREIAHHLDMSLGSVNRAMRMWSPFDDRPKRKPRPVRKPRPRPAEIAKTVEQETPLLDRSDAGEADRVVEESEIGTPGQIDNLPINDQTPEPAYGDSILDGLPRSLDSRDREIFVEKESETGKPVIWYRRDKHGKIHRSEQKGFTILNSVVEEMGSRV